MYDTEKRIELVKKRMHEYHRRQERRTVCRLSVLCTLLFLSLVGTMGIMHSQPIDITGMYGAILLHDLGMACIFYGNMDLIKTLV